MAGSDTDCVSFPRLSRRDAIGLIGAAAFVPPTCGYAAGSEAAIARDLAGHVDGRLIARGDPGYEVVRADIWCANVPARYPAAVLRARSTADVAAAVRYASRAGLRVAIRGGGHNWPAASLRDDALLIDLGGMKNMVIDGEARTARVQPGVSGGALFHAAAGHGLTFPVAHCPSVPMSGYLLNGGYGFNAGHWGPAALHVTGMEMVDANGEVIRLDERSNADLFWAARGGGPGFFGIITRFDIRLLPMPRALHMTTYVLPLAATAEATAALDAVRDACPDTVELTFLAAAQGGPPESPGIGIVSGIAFRDDDAAARADLAFLKDYQPAAKPFVADLAARTDWNSLFEAVAGLFPPRMNYLGNTIWTDAKVADMYVPYADHLRSAPSPHAFSNCVLYPAGLAKRIAETGGALSMHGRMLSLQYAIWADPADNARNETWFNQSVALFQGQAHGHYIGELDLNLYPQFARGAFARESWARLAALRKHHDPSARFFDYLGNDGAGA